MCRTFTAVEDRPGQGARRVGANWLVVLVTRSAVAKHCTSAQNGDTPLQTETYTC